MFNNIAEYSDLVSFEILLIALFFLLLGTWFVTAFSIVTMTIAANLISSELFLIQNIHHVFSQQSLMAICDAAHINAPQQWWGVNMIAHMAFYHFGFFSPKNPNPDSLLLGRAVRRWYEQTWPSVCLQCKHTCGQSSQNKMMTIRKEIEYESSILKMTSRCQKNSNNWNCNWISVMIKIMRAVVIMIPMKNGSSTVQITLYVT